MKYPILKQTEHAFDVNAFSNNGLFFSLKDGRKTYKVVYRNSMKVFEFFKESEI